MLKENIMVKKMERRLKGCFFVFLVFFFVLTSFRVYVLFV